MQGLLGAAGSVDWPLAYSDVRLFVLAVLDVATAQCGPRQQALVSETRCQLPLRFTLDWGAT